MDTTLSGAAKSTQSGLALHLALALGPGADRALPWPEDREAWLRRSWREERDRYPRWAGARGPADLLRRMERLARRLEALDAQCTFLDQLERYPEALRGLHRPPAALFFRGILPQEGRAVAVVGSRAAFKVDLEQAHAIAQELAEGGISVVSGGALGIDAAAHEGALAAKDGAPTIVVLGSGLGQPYPARNRPLFERVIEAGGCLLSPYLPDEPGKRWHFPARNTLIAALSELTLVVAAATRSGALDTAFKTHRMGRSVAAIPRTPGCRRLIACGEATAVHDAHDVMALLDGEEVDRLVDLTDEQRALLAAMPHEQPISIDELAIRRDLSPGRVAMLLLQLELEGLVVGQEGTRYRSIIGPAQIHSGGER
ncbi:MAG: DNA processing protein DprA [Proteobacteria bacterium]|nr:MAG: DNA processing protein DprA [Pseudomonadota bacterium]PIE19690.1 MAG: DNA processing protein DprA [Pseudomonadota bacterium]